MRKAFYREYRPMTFDEVLGQNPIITTLKNQVENDKINHSYIFSGTRGTGKTSCAKIMARAVNCLDPQDGNPCNECENCKMILSETTMDVVEMDAASNRRIDDIRDLRDKVIYPPSQLKYKVYIIDEAHMITNEGFNALLKIMEEPPSHLIFILATTEIERIPSTILSRCQRYDFKRIERFDIEKSLRSILSDLSINMDDAAIDLITRKADGAMRDAQSILDQATSSEKTHITVDDVEQILGVVDNDQVIRLMQAIVQKDIYRALEETRKIIQQGKDPSSLLKELMKHYSSVIVLKTSGSKNVSNNPDLLELYGDLSAKSELSELTDALEILVNHIGKLKFTEDAEILLELTVIQLVEAVDRNALLSRIAKLERQVELLLTREEMGGVSRSRPSNQTEPPTLSIESPEWTESTVIKRSSKEKTDKTEARSDAPLQAEPNRSKKTTKRVDLMNIKGDWKSFVEFSINRNPFWSYWMKALVPYRIEEDEILTILVEDGQKTFKVSADKNLKELESLFEEYFGCAFGLRVGFKSSYLETPPNEEPKVHPTEEKLKKLFSDKLKIKEE